MLDYVKVNPNLQQQMVGFVSTCPECFSFEPVSDEFMCHPQFMTLDQADLIACAGYEHVLLEYAE